MPRSRRRRSRSSSSDSYDSETSPSPSPRKRRSHSGKRSRSARSSRRDRSSSPEQRSSRSRRSSRRSRREYSSSSSSSREQSPVRSSHRRSRSASEPDRDRLYNSDPYNSNTYGPMIMPSPSYPPQQNEMYQQWQYAAFIQQQQQQQQFAEMMQRQQEMIQQSQQEQRFQQEALLRQQQQMFYQQQQLQQQQQQRSYSTYLPSYEIPLHQPAEERSRWRIGGSSVPASPKGRAFPGVAEQSMVKASLPNSPRQDRHEKTTQHRQPENEPHDIPKSRLSTLTIEDESLGIMSTQPGTPPPKNPSKSSPNSPASKFITPETERRGATNQEDELLKADSPVHKSPVVSATPERPQMHIKAPTRPTTAHAVMQSLPIPTYDMSSSPAFIRKAETMFQPMPTPYPTFPLSPSPSFPPGMTLSSMYSPMGIQPLMGSPYIPNYQPNPYQSPYQPNYQQSFQQQPTYQQAPYPQQPPYLQQSTYIPQSPPLPDNIEAWSQHRDPQSGMFFFFNSLTGESTWDVPSEWAEDIEAEVQEESEPEENYQVSVVEERRPKSHETRRSHETQKNVDRPKSPVIAIANAVAGTISGVAQSLVNVIDPGQLVLHNKSLPERIVGRISGLISSSSSRLGLSPPKKDRQDMSLQMAEVRMKDGLAEVASKRYSEEFTSPKNQKIELSPNSPRQFKDAVSPSGSRPDLLELSYVPASELRKRGIDPPNNPPKSPTVVNSWIPKPSEQQIDDEGLP